MIRITIALTISLSSLPALAADKSAVESSEVGAMNAAASGRLSPFSVSPRLPRMVGAVALGGYDSAADAFRARGSADGRLLDFLAARVEFDHGPANGPESRVSLGLRAAFLNQAKHGIDFGAMTLYQPRDFREEGNVVVGLLLARCLDRVTLVLNPMAGSDPEGDDQSLEVRVAALYRASPWLVVGLDSRGRYNLSDDAKRASTFGIDWEIQSGASAALGVGPLLLTTLVGPSFLRRTHFGLDASAGNSELFGGILAMAGAGAAF